MSDLKEHQILAGLTVRSKETLLQHFDAASLADQLLDIANKLRASLPSSTPGPIAENCSRPTADIRNNRHSLGRRATHSDHAQLRQLNAQLAREIYAARRQRSTIFGNPELFGEPAWDILLDLYIAYVEDKPVSVSSACIGSAAPPTTGLRWLGVLAEQDLILREHDPEDQRRVLVRLTELGLASMDEYFASVAAPA